MDNIQIASFDFDDAKIYQKLDELGTQIEDLNVKREQERRTLSELNKQYNETSKEMERLSKTGRGQSAEYDDLVNKQNELTRSIVKQKQEISDITAETKGLSAETKDLVKTLDAQQNMQRILSDTYDLESKSINELREDRKLLIQLRNQEVAVMGEQSETAKAYNQLIAEMTNQEKKLVAETEQRFYQIGDYAGQLQDQFTGIIDAIKQIGSGDIVGGIDGLKNSFSGLLASARAFVLTPIGAVITALVALGAAAKYVWDYNAAIKENLELIEQMADQTGKSADKIRQSIQSITDTYGRDFEEVLQEVKDLAEDFGVSYEKALDAYNKGLATGGNLNKEFGDSIREYGVLFDQAGYSAEEFVSLLNTGFDLGIYTDKLPDAIKEAGLSLNEQTKSTRDALVNAFGATFTDDILKRVKLGKTSVKDALNEIAKASKDANLNQQQLAQLTADVFKGAGEDAGGALVIFQALNQSVERLNRPLTELEQRSEDLRVSYEELEKAKDDAFKSEVVIKLQNDLKILWNVTLKNLIERVSSFIRITTDGFTQINAGLGTFDKYLQNIDVAISKLSFRNLKQSWDELKKSITSFDWDSTYEKLAGDSSVEGQKRRKQRDEGNSQVRDIVNGIADVSNEATKKRLNELNGKDRNAGPTEAPKTKKVKTAKKKNDDAKKDLETAKKMQAEYYKELAELAYQYGQNELSEQIKLNSQKLEQAKILTDEMLALEIEKLNKIKALEDERAKNEKQRADERVTQEYEASLKEIESLKVSENEKNALKLQAEQVLNAQKLANQQQLDANLLEQMRYNEEMKLELEAELYENRMAIEQQRRDFEFQQKMLRLQNENTSEKDMNLIMLSQQYTEEMALLRDKLNNQLITTEQFAEASANLTKWKTNKEVEIEEIASENKRNLYSSMLSELSSLFEKNTMAYKVTASAGALIDTYSAANRAMTDKTVPNFYVRLINAGIATARGLANVVAINKVNTKSTAIGSGGGGTPSLGTSTKNYTASYAGGAMNGLDGNSTISGYNQSNIFGGLDGTSAIADAVRLGAEQGTAKGSQDGIVGLSTNRQIMNDAKY